MFQRTFPLVPNFRTGTQMTRFSSVIRGSEQDWAAMGAGAGEG